ncbi:MAG: lipopolysaccharide heptosyltransferase II [Mariprofundaceae bacterium]
MIPQPEHLVIHAPNWLGDAVMAQPAMHAFILGLHPKRTTLTGMPWLADILPWFDLPGAEYAAKNIGGDVHILFPNSFRAAWNALRSGAKHRIGYSGQWRSPLLSHAIKPRFSMDSEHHRDYYNDLATQNGINVAQPGVHLTCREKDLHAGERWLASKAMAADKAICIAPGAQFGGAKRYPAERWAAVIEILSARGYQIVALGTPAERDIAAQSLKLCTGSTCNSAGETSLNTCLQLIAASRGLLCNDSGLMHIAAGLGKPVVAVFGATDPQRTAPSGANVELIYHPAACSPCLQRECSVPGQPCMQNVQPEEVAQAFIDKIEATGVA